MKTKIAVLALLLAVGSGLGCRTIWIHPGATQQKYTDDLYRCRFGAEPPSEAEIRNGEMPAAIKVRRDWKECMALLGWSHEVGMRWSKPYAS